MKTHNLRQIDLIDSEGEYEYYGQLYSSFLTDAPPECIKACIDACIDRYGNEDQDDLETILCETMQNIIKAGYVLTTLPPVEQHHIR